MAATDDELLKLYTSVPEARSYPSPQPLDQFEQDLLRQYTTVPTAAATAPAKKGKGLANNDDDSTFTSIAKNIATGAIKGVGDIPGTLGNVADFGTYLAMRGVNALTGRPLAEMQAESDQGKAAAAKWYGEHIGIVPPQLKDGDHFAAPVLDKTGEYVPDSTGSRMLQSGVRAITASGSPANAFIKGSVGAATQGITDATGDPLIGALAGVAVPGAVAGGKAAGNKLMGKIAPDTANLASSAMDKYNIPLGPGNISGSPAVRFLDSAVSKLPFSGGEKTRVAQQEAFNKAVGSTFGAPESKLTPSVMANARDRIGADFDFVAQNTKMTPDQPMAIDFAKVVKETKLAPAGTEARVRANIQEVADLIQRNGGQIPYQDLTRVGSPNGRGAGIVQKLINDQDPHVREAGVGLRNALDDALQRQAPPELVQTLQTARQHWRNMRTVEDLVPKGSPGDITPALLQGRVNAKNKGTYGAAYGGGGDLGELGTIGQRFLKEPPSSGTAERAGIYGALAMGTGAIGNMLVNPTAANIAYSVGAPLAGLAVGRGANALLRNQNLARGIVNRSLPGQPTGWTNRLLPAP